MSLQHLKPFREVSASALDDLQTRITAFYNNPPASYYLIANQAAEQYTLDQQPFHCHLASRAFPGAKVLELGCGTAHLCPHIEERGGIYHGVDYSAELLEENRKRFPWAVFWSLGSQPEAQYDIVASLYTIEHVIDPIAYLQQLWDYCRPGGLMAVICPDFVDGDGIPRSIYYGTSPARLRAKLAGGRFWDAILHLLELKIIAPRWKRRARRRPPGTFWMNLDPSDLAGREHGIDGDAIHFPRMVDISGWFETRGATIQTTSSTLENVPKAVLKHNCYVLARKPTDAR